MIINKLKTYTLWLLLSLLLGCIGGVLGTAFFKVLQLVTLFRTQADCLVFFLPLGGLLSVAIYKLLNVKSVGALSVFESTKTNTPLPHSLTAGIFLSTSISHLFGASVGREGAALQIGGGIANSLARLFKLDQNSRYIMLLCGMAALFSALFGTPLAAAVFVVEIIMTRLCFVGLIPIFISSLSAFKIATYLGVHPERFDIGSVPKISCSFFIKSSAIIIVCAAVAFLWCGGLRVGKQLFKQLFKNEFIRIAVGGIIIVLLTLLVGNRDYNGGGVDVITKIFENGTVRYEAFVLKLLFTIICVSSGFKGGQIVPTIFIGAALGGVLAVLFSLPIGIGAAIGIAVLFCAASKCPVATVLLCCEMFGFKSIFIVAFSVTVGLVLSCFYKGLYNNFDYVTINIIKRLKPR